MSISSCAPSTIAVLSDGGKLFATMAALPHVEGQEIVISAKDGRPARRARARVSWQEIEAPRPRVGFDVERLAPTVKLNAVRVEEIDPPAGVKPIVWLLLTTHPVENLEDALCGSWAGIGRGSDDRAGVPGHEEPRFRSGGQPDRNP
jgi:hypothetical protein